MGALFDAMMAAEAKRAKRKPSIVDAPEGAIVLWRPDTKTRKAMGWALVEAHCVAICLDLEVERPNIGFRGMTVGAMMGHRNRVKRERSWARSAVEQAIGKRDAKPAKITFSRVSSGCMDDDGVVGAFKATRDGVADALGVNDRDFSIGGMVPGKTPVFYAQIKPGRQGVKAVILKFEWGSTP